MPRTHGWDGRPPESDEEAIDRILEATQRCIRRNAAKASINEVALELGVTRPTVYRYFASTDALLTAATIQAAGAFLERVLARMAPFDDPVEAIIESIAFTVEELPLDCNMASLLAAGRLGTFAAGVTSETAMAFSRVTTERFRPEWTRRGVSESTLEQLTEWLLRVEQSFLIDPGPSLRHGPALRAYLRAWLSPALRIQLGYAALSSTEEIKPPSERPAPKISRH